MKKFASGPISFPNAAEGLRCRATRIRIGSKPGDNFFLKPLAPEPSAINLTKRIDTNVALFSVESCSVNSCSFVFIRG